MAPGVSWTHSDKARCMSLNEIEQCARSLDYQFRGLEMPKHVRAEFRALMDERFRRTARTPLPPPPGSHLASTYDGGRTWVHHDRPLGQRASFVIRDEIHHHNPTQESSMAPLPTGTFEFKINTASPDAQTAAKELRKEAKRIEKAERWRKRQRKAQKRAARERLEIREQAIKDLRAISAKREGYRAVEAAAKLLEVTE